MIDPTSKLVEKMFANFFVQVQRVPYPVWEVKKDPGLLTLLYFIEQDTLPEDMGLFFGGELYRFRSKLERKCFAMGLSLTINYMTRNVGDTN